MRKEVDGREVETRLSWLPSADGLETFTVFFLLVKFCGIYFCDFAIERDPLHPICPPPPFVVS